MKYIKAYFLVIFTVAIITTLLVFSCGTVPTFSHNPVPVYVLDAGHGALI